MLHEERVLRDKLHEIRGTGFKIRGTRYSIAVNGERTEERQVSHGLAGQAEMGLGTKWKKPPQRKASPARLLTILPDYVKSMINVIDKSINVNIHI